MASSAGSPLRNGASAAAIVCGQPRASKLVAGAVSAGLVRREADQADGRRTNLVLTADGRRQLDVVHGFRRERFAAAMEDWTADERKVFADLLARFVTALDR
ncbi:MarR family winged helix-turn-helix transcriptional regulator [Kribbella sp. NBC_00709]|uniref:MarR family winged helix-turn-helix transcriptional regulator n=1 Tax=Kribbella sp. NBC_00709 TaxID=2975972 RepID=UPI002E27C404|nr:MarR family winged helix-turn-helix transcriptional regulator [Kribbella sp. NBC_00709]